MAERLIASADLAGVNTRRVRRALAGVARRRRPQSYCEAWIWRKV